MEKIFTIDRVSWHTGAQGNPETREHVVRRFWSIVNFLQLNGLTSHQLAEAQSDIHDDFAITSNDVSALGLELLKAGYHKWLTQIDKGRVPEDVEILSKILTRLKK